MEIAAILKSYKLWAPIYDLTFGAVSHQSRRKTVDYINSRQGRVLEIGVGTGLALDRYKSHLEVTGIDVSPNMLEKARRKVAEKKLSHIVRIDEMDARSMAFPDDHFDVVVAMFLVSVVPEPERTLAEMARVCKPGGEIVIINHFARKGGILGRIEHFFAPHANLLGWHSDFEMHRVTGTEALEVISIQDYPPFGLFKLLKQRKRISDRAAA